MKGSQKYKRDFFFHLMIEEPKEISFVLAMLQKSRWNKTKFWEFYFAAGGRHSLLGGNILFDFLQRSKIDPLFLGSNEPHPKEREREKE